MRACYRCGAQIPEDAAFCPACGTQQSGAARPERPAGGETNDQEAGSGRATPAYSRKRTSIVVAAVVFASLLTVIGAGAFLFADRAAQGALVSLTTGQPIAGATIRTVSDSVKTDDSGRFVLPKLRIGTQVVTVTVEGYAPFEASLQVPVAGATLSTIKLPDASVTVHVEEVAVQPQAIASAEVKIGSTAASLTPSGTYELKGLKPGPTVVEVTAPSSHEPTKTTLTLKPGKNDVRVRVYLTPAETYSRYFQAYKSGRWSSAYAYLHPDVAKRESLATFTKDMQAWGTPLSLTMNGTRMLPRWTSPYTDVAYTNVAEIRRTLVGVRRGAHYANTTPQHWTNVGGLWLRVDI